MKRLLDRPSGYDPRTGLMSAGASLLIGLGQGMGLQLVSTNLPAVQGALDASAAEATWLTAAYFSAAIPAVLLLTKFRLHFGLRGFANIGLSVFLAVAALHLLTQNIASAIAVRAALGFASAALSTAAVLYMVQAFPPKLAGAGLVLGFAAAQLAAPLARIVSTDLLQFGQWHGLFLLDVALALVSLAAVHVVDLNPAPREPAFSAGDAIAFPLFALGVVLLCVAATQGRIRWWTDTAWIGYSLAGAIASFGLYLLVDMNRPRPMLDIPWLLQPFVFNFVIAVLLFRVVLGEQTFGMVGLMNILGQNNDQMHGLFGMVFAGMLFGFVLAIALAAVKVHADLIGAIAAGLIAVAAWMDSSATALTRPAQLLATQAMQGIGLALFFAASIIGGFGKAMYFGALLGPAWLGTFLADRQKQHYAALAQHLTLTDPDVVRRLEQLGGAVTGTVGDPARRAAESVAQLAQQTSREAYVLAYNDLFQLVAAVATAVAVWLVLLWLRAPRVSPPSPPPSSTPSPSPTPA